MRMPDEPAQLESLWTTQQTAAFLNVGVSTLFAWRQEGYGPPPIVLRPGKGGLVRYSPQAVREWLAARTEPVGAA